MTLMMRLRASSVPKFTRQTASFQRGLSTALKEKSSAAATRLSTRSKASPVVLVGVSLVTGYVIGHLSSTYQPHDQQHQNRQLPSGLPRTCCDQHHPGGHLCDHQDHHDSLSASQQALPSLLSKIVGKENVLDGRQNTTQTLPFLKGARLGGGSQALAIVTPRNLQDVVKCVQAIVDADCIIVPQGANTGLTGGSVPRDGDRRPSVVVSMKYLDTIFPIDNGQRVVCLAGAGLATLARSLSTWFPNRESHSILGSTFLNPSTAAGVALGSGGTQLRKGPAYTDRALYLKVFRNKFGENIVQVVNTLGIKGIEDEDFPDGKGSAIEQLDVYQRDVREGYTRAMATSSKSRNGQANASDRNYAHNICQHDHNVSRYNCDTKGLECNRSEGKVLILATIHDTFEKPIASRTFWISFDSFQTALDFRKQVCLDNPKDLPVSVEYMDRDSFDVIDRSGRVLASLIKAVGPAGSIVKTMWNVKLWIESLPFSGSPLWCDKALYLVNNVFPATLPSRIMKTGKAMDHHVAMTVGEFGDGSMERLLDRLQGFASERGEEKIVIHECETLAEARSLTAFRFVAAPAFRTWCVGEGVQGFSVDYGLPKNDGRAPPISTKPLKRMRYSHFGCQVVHEDLAYAPEVDTHKAKMELKQLVEDQGGQLPAEHGHGTEYKAPKETKERWKKMDPLNVMNPGVGGLSMKRQYQ